MINSCYSQRFGMKIWNYVTNSANAEFYTYTIFIFYIIPPHKTHGTNQKQSLNEIWLGVAVDCIYRLILKLLLSCLILTNEFVPRYGVFWVGSDVRHRFLLSPAPTYQVQQQDSTFFKPPVQMMIPLPPHQVHICE